MRRPTTRREAPRRGRQARALTAEDKARRCQDARERYQSDMNSPRSTARATTEGERRYLSSRGNRRRARGREEDDGRVLRRAVARDHWRPDSSASAPWAGAWRVICTRPGCCSAVWNRTHARADELAGELGVVRRPPRRPSWLRTATSSCCASQPTRTCSIWWMRSLPGLRPGSDRHRLLDGQRGHRARGGAAGSLPGRSSSSTPRSAAASKAPATERSRSWSAARGGVRARRARCCRRWAAP